MIFGEFKELEQINFKNIEKEKITVCVNGEELNQDLYPYEDFDHLNVTGSGHNPNGSLLIDLVDDEDSKEEVEIDYTKLATKINNYYGLKVIAPIVITLIVVLSMLFLSNKWIDQQVKIRTQQETINNLLKDNSDLKSQVDKYELELANQGAELDNCFVCGNDHIKITTSYSRYYIKCSKCGINTDWYDTKNELIQYWNSIGEDNVGDYNE